LFFHYYISYFSPTLSPCTPCTVRRIRVDSLVCVRACVVEGKQYRWKCVARHTDTPPPPAQPFYLFRRSAKQTDGRITTARVIITTPAPLLIGHLYHLKVAIGQILIYADNCQKRRRRKRVSGSLRASRAHDDAARAGGRTVETRADSGTSSMLFSLIIIII